MSTTRLVLFLGERSEVQSMSQAARARDRGAAPSVWLPATGAYRRFTCARKWRREGHGPLSPSIFILSELDPNERKTAENNHSHYLAKSLGKDQRVAALVHGYLVPSVWHISRAPRSGRGSAVSVSGCVGPQDVFALPAPPESEPWWHFSPGTRAMSVVLETVNLVCSWGSWESGSLPPLCTLRKETHLTRLFRNYSILGR